jgi:hypothetical protein
LNKRVYGYDTPGLATAPIWSTFKGNAQRTGGMLKSPYIVPVELNSFTALIEDNNVILSWITSTETNNSGFEVQRKKKNEQEWNNIAFVKGNGTVTTSTYYSFTDNNIGSGIFNYRIMQVDYDGTSKYYYLNTDVSADIPQEFELSQNYPNPFNPETMIKYRIPEEGIVNIKLYNMLGKETAVLVNKNMQPGYYELRLNALDYDLASGVYFYTLNAGSYTSTKKMIIAK